MGRIGAFAWKTGLATDIFARCKPLGNGNAGDSTQLRCVNPCRSVHERVCVNTFIRLRLQGESASRRCKNMRQGVWRNANRLPGRAAVPIPILHSRSPVCHLVCPFDVLGSNLEANFPPPTMLAVRHDSYQGTGVFICHRVTWAKHVFINSCAVEHNSTVPRICMLECCVCNGLIHWLYYLHP